MSEYDFTNLTEAQQWLLTYKGWTASTSPELQPQPQHATVKKLIERGLVIPHKVQRGMVEFTEYEVPLAVHMAWCDFCAQFPE